MERSMLKPLEEWKCDTCGEVIESPEAGMVEWIGGIDIPAHEFGIIHQTAYSPYYEKDDFSRDDNCYSLNDRPHHKNRPLSQFVGSQGVVLIASFIDVGEFYEPEYAGPSFKNGREFAKFVRRLQVPYYEEARLYWRNAERDGFFDGQNEVGIYRPEILQSVIEQYK